MLDPKIDHRPLRSNRESAGAKPLAAFPQNAMMRHDLGFAKDAVT